MSEMVERAARALCYGMYGHSDYDALHDDSKNELRISARVVIKAIRELPEEPGPRYTAGEYSRRNHEAMIDDALRE